MYSKLIGSNSPGLLVILVDQSQSMADPYADKNKAEFAALAVNRTIYEILESCMSGEKIKDRCHISVIGYGEKTEMIVGGMPSEIKNPSHGHETYKRKISDGAGGLVDVEQSLPIWVKARSANGTPMAEAFGLASDLIEPWTRENLENFPPVVFNITDGEPNDKSAAKEAAAKVAGFKTTDGSVVVYNCHIGTGTPEIKLPATDASLTEPGARLLFEMSTIIPTELFPLAQNAGLNPQQGSRGFCMNATPETFIKLLTFGSAMAR
jgi:uncharacterized protein YegL